METGPPSWLNKSFLTEVLEDERNDQQNVEVQEFSINLAVKAGNNYLSQIYRVPIEYKVGKEEKLISLIIKVPLTTGFLVEMQGNLIDTEPILYEEVLPKMDEKVNHQFGPKFFKSSQKSSMVLQDLKADGFSMCDRLKRLDSAHCRVVVETIAKFHASSVACYNENPDLIRSVSKERLYSADLPLNEEKRQWLKETVLGLADMISAIGGSKEAADLLLRRSDQIAVNMERICQTKAKGLNVLNHGDLWTNNMLFKYNDNSKVVDMKLLDFQLTRFTSPVLDLMYFIWTSAKEEVYAHELKELIQLYLTTLNETLKQIGCDEQLTEEEFNEDLKNSLDFSIVVACQALPFIMCDEDNIINMEEIKSDDMKSGQADEKFKQIFTGKSFVSVFPSVIQHLTELYSSLN